MLKRNTEIGKYLEHLHAEADLVVHHIFFDMEHCKALFARDTGDYGGVFEIVVAGDDICTFVLWTVGISDVYRDPGILDGEDAVLVQYGCAHV